MKAYKILIIFLFLAVPLFSVSCDDSSGNSGNTNNTNNTNNANNANNTNNVNNTNNTNNINSIEFNPSGIDVHMIPSGNKFYVDPVNGSDNASGTFEDPWRNLQNVLDTKVSTREYDSFPVDPSSVLIPKNGDQPVKSGDVIVLRAGNYGNIQIKNAYNDDFITIKAYEGEKAVLASLRVEAASYWNIEDIEITQENEEIPQKTDLIYIADHNYFGPTSYIVVNNCKAYSVSDSSAWTETEWNELSCDGVSVRASHVVVRECEFKNVDFGISYVGSYGNVSRCSVTNFAGDGMRGIGQNLLFEYNTVKNCYDVNENHDDGFQSWALDGVPSSDIVLRGNVIINNEDPDQPLAGPLQGIGCFDGPYKNWLIENNLVIVDHYHGITLLGAENVKVRNNTVIDYNPGNDMQPWINIGDHKDGTPSINSIIKNNVVANQILMSTGLTEGNNYSLKDATDLSLLFVDPVNFDFRLVSGSPLIDAGDGSDYPAVDLDGNSRPQGTFPDIGAYEYAP